MRAITHICTCLFTEVRKNFTDRSIACSACLLISAWLPARAGSDIPQNQPLTSQEVVAKVSQSIVRVNAYFSYQIDGQQKREDYGTSGTGFVVDSLSRIATAEHVVSVDLNQHAVERMLASKGLRLVPRSFRRDAVQVFVLLPNRQIPGQLIFYGNAIPDNIKSVTENQHLDIAILTPETSLTTARGAGWRSVPTFQSDDVNSGEPVTIVGFPAIVMGNQVQQMQGPTTNTGSVSNPFVLDEFGRSVIFLDLRANHGDSGGLAFNSTDGRVLGFVDEGYMNTDGQYSGLMSIIPIRDILAMVPKT